MNRKSQMTLLALMATLGVVAVVQAEFLGLDKTLTIARLEDGTPASVVRIYARMSCPENRVFAVEQASIGCGALYHHPFGTGVEPPGALILTFPDLAYDSFVTINKESTSDAGPPTALESGSFFGSSGFDGGWFTDPKGPQTLGQPMPDVGDGDYFVLLAQLTTVGDDQPCYCPSGEWTVHWLNASGEEVVSTADPACPLTPSEDDADFNNDGLVNGFDLAILLSNWGPCGEWPATCQVPGDLFLDGVIDGFDIARLLSLWRPWTDCAGASPR